MCCNSEFRLLVLQGVHYMNRHCKGAAGTVSIYIIESSVRERQNGRNIHWDITKNFSVGKNKMSIYNLL